MNNNKKKSIFNRIPHDPNWLKKIELEKQRREQIAIKKEEEREEKEEIRLEEENKFIEKFTDHMIQRLEILLEKYIEKLNQNPLL